MAEEVKLDITLDGIKKDLADLRVELNKLSSSAVSDFSQIAAAAKKAGKETNDAFKIGTAQGVADALDQLQKEYDDLAKSAKTLKTALQGATDPTAVKLYATSIAQLEVGMKKLEQTGKVAGVNLKDANKEANVGKQAFEGMFGAFTKVTLIIAAIDAVRKFVVSAVALSQETDKATKSFEAFLGSADKAKGVVADLTGFAQKKFLDTENVFQAGKGLLAFGESADNLTPVLSRIADLSAATGKDFNELVTIYGKARTAGVLYAEDINQLVDAGIPIIQEFAKQMGVSNDQVKKLASEGKISFEELQLAFFNLTKEGQQFAGQAEAQAETLTGVWKGLFNEVRPAISAIGDFFSDIAKGIGFLLTDLVQGIKSLFGVDQKAKVDIEVDYTGRDAYEQAKDDLFEQERLEKAAAKRRSELAKKNSGDAAKYERELAQARIAAMKDGEQKEIAQENFRFKELIAQLRRFHLDTAEAEEQHQKNVLKIRVKYELIRISEQEAALNAEQESIKNGLAEIASLQEDERKRLADLAAKNSKAQEESAALSKENFEAILLAGREVFFSKKRTDKEIDQYEKDVAKMRELFQLEQQQAELQRALDFGQELSDAEKATLQQRIKNISTQIEQIKKGVGEQAKEGKPVSLLDFLGIDPKDQDAFKDAVSESIDALHQLGEARLAEAQAAVDAANIKVDAAETAVDKAQEALDREIQLAELGFASNVSLRQQELAAAEQQQKQAEAQRKKAIENQQKIQRQQIILDSVLQASNLITSSTNIYKVLSPLGPFGVGLAIGAIALMLGSFIKQKAAALKAIGSVKAREGLQARIGNDGVIVGPSHDHGGVPLEVEGGELVYQDGKRVSVVKKRSTQTHFDLLKAINDDDRPAMARYVERMTGGIGRDIEATGAVVASVRETLVLSQQPDAATRKLWEKNNQLIEENNKLTQKLLDTEKDRVQIFDMGDYYLRVERGRETRIKKGSS